MEETYRGWPVKVLGNQWLNLTVAPELGGRLIQLALDGYEYLFVNPALAGFRADDTRLGPNGTWLNYGGEKIWPAPQGWDSAEQWPGPPDPVLDGGVYEATHLLTPEEQQAIVLTSPVDSHTGLQSNREVWLSDNQAEVVIKATFTNRSDRPRRWSIWPVCQVNVPMQDQHPRCQIICPTNPNSRFSGGYTVMHGLVNNPQNRLDGQGNLVVEYDYLIGKVGLDALAGWVAFVNRGNGKVLVMRYDCPEAQYDEFATYPDDTSVQIWTQGRGMIYSRNRIAEFVNDPVTNPPYMELELLSPLAEMLPGNSITYTYRLLACTVPPGESVHTVNEVGVVVRRLSTTQTAEGVQVRGQYGVFSEGILTVILTRNASETPDGQTVLLERSVSPKEGIVIDVTIPYATGFSSDMDVLLLLSDTLGRPIGHLDTLSFYLHKDAF